MKGKTTKCTAVILALSMSSVPVMASEFVFDDGNVSVESAEMLPITPEESPAVFEDGNVEATLEDASLSVGVEELENSFSDGAVDAAMAIDDTAARNEWGNRGASTNTNAQNYTHAWSKPINSYLIPVETGYMRVENRNNQILIEYYDASLNFQSQKFIPGELSKFGGFYAGANNYYLAFGQNNDTENNSLEVVRVVKYDKNWNRLGHASLCGANTTKPFDFGTLRMLEYGEFLYVRTCHVMYKSSDGLNHQSTLSLQIRTSDMSVVDSAYLVDHKGGYVSHSFNQFLLTDNDGTLLSLDQGDAYPRAFAIHKYNDNASGKPLSNGDKEELVLSFPGGWGQNDTGASIGGFELSTSDYLTAGSSVRLIEGIWDYKEQRNVFVTTTSKNAMGDNASICRYYSNYPANGSLSASTPHLVKLNSDSFLLIWAQMVNKSPNGKICYIYLNGQGRPASGVYTKNGYLSDCKPVVANGKVIWYVTNGQNLTFYQISGRGILQTTTSAFNTSAASEFVPCAMEFTSGEAIEQAELLTSDSEFSIQ